MAKILGLDLGTNSIGWAVINVIIEDGKVVKYISIDDTGVLIFPEGVEPTTIGKGDKEQSKNSTRREHRQNRRQVYRKKVRKFKLLQSLIGLNMCPLSIDSLNQWGKWKKTEKTEGKKFPSEPEFIKWLKLNPYELRYRGLSEDLSLLELGRVFYHFMQHRGFLSSRKGGDEGAIYKGKDNMTGINDTRNLIGTDTLGKKLYEILPKEGEEFHYKTDANGNELRVRSRYTERGMYIEEFLKIWERQTAHLGLDNMLIKSSKVRFLKGNLESNRNRKKINNYFDKYGKENVEIAGGKVTTYKEILLKTFLAGEIESGIDGIKFKSNESLLFWQLPLRSQKNLLDNCRFEQNRPVLMGNGDFRRKNGEIVYRSKKPCPLSHPEFELFRSYQIINNIKYGKGERLTDDQRKLVLDVFSTKDNSFKFEQIVKALKLTYEEFNYDLDQKISGNPTIKKLKPLFPEEVWNRCYEKIWHCFYFYDDNVRLLKKLKEDYQLKNSFDIEKIKKIRIAEGYSNVSLKAIRNINPFLAKGFTFSEAVVLGGIKNAFGPRWEFFNIPDIIGGLESDVLRILHEKGNKEGEAINKIKDYLSDPLNNYGFSENDPAFTQLYHHSQEIENRDIEDWVPELENLRNPIVQQALYEMRRLVNELLRKYRKQDPGFIFSRIHVEMGRNLKNTKSKRQEISVKANENTNKNENARQRLAELGQRPSRDNLLRYLLYDEIQKHSSGPVLCPYTGKVISVADLLDGTNAVQIEHIIPKSISLDDSFSNKTLCESKFNNLKGEKTPFEFYLINHDYKLWGIQKHDNIKDGWNEITERVYKILPYAKARKFSSKNEFKVDDFIERQLNDSRYISRKAVELLSSICSDVRMLPGQVTAELRHLWGINNILNPVCGMQDCEVEVKAGKRLAYYVLTDEHRKVKSMLRKTNDRPTTNSNQLVLSGILNKNVLSSKYLSLKINVPNMIDGKYWVLVNVSDKTSLFPVFAKKPVSDLDHLVLKGRVEKGFFKNDTIGNNIKVKEDRDGAYWARFSVKKFELKIAENKGKVKTKTSEVALFGEVKNGLFVCHIYQCKTNLPDGKYWAFMQLDFEGFELMRVKNIKPETNQNQILGYVTVDENENMVADIDPAYSKRTEQNPGRYYCVFNIESIEQDLYPMENDPPKPKKGEVLTEAVVWVDEATGEIRYDPKKNREDHRHHAIDAITVALTEQGFMQRLSTYYAKEENKNRSLDNSEKFPMPWDGFEKDVKKFAESILISHKQNNKVLTRISKKIEKNGVIYKSVGFSARGQLHKDTVYGKRTPPGHKEAYHVRKPITSLEDKKQIGKVVDGVIRNLILEHLRDNCGVDISNDSFKVPKDAFFKNGKPRLFLPNRKGGEPVPVKKVRVRENFGNAHNLKSSVNQYVDLKNNHHALIYLKYDGKLGEAMVSYWEAVERQKQGAEVFRLPADGKESIAILQTNDMFLLGLSNEEFENNKNNPAFLSKYLYRVQNISSKDYLFRHHLASIVTNKNDQYRIQSFKAFQKANPIKVLIDKLGSIDSIE